MLCTATPLIFIYFPGKCLADLVKTLENLISTISLRFSFLSWKLSKSQINNGIYVILHKTNISCFRSKNIDLLLSKIQKYFLVRRANKSSKLYIFLKDWYYLTLSLSHSVRSLFTSSSPELPACTLCWLKNKGDFSSTKTCTVLPCTLKEL